MAELPWDIGIIQWFAEHRIEWLTPIFQFFTFLGNEQGYILIVLLVYWLYNKRIAIQVTLGLLLTSILNHILKIIIQNPRPFVTDGTYHDKWALPEDSIEETALSYSTPSGHAQGSSTFWWYLHLKVKSRVTFILLPIMVFAIGISRPYLGVHYLEDVIIGWIVGFLVVVFLMRYDEPIARWWNNQSDWLKLSLSVIIPIIIMIVAGILSDFEEAGKNFATYGAIFTGIVVGYDFQEKHIGFEPSLSVYDNLATKTGIAIARMLLGVLIVAIFLIGLDVLFGLIAEDNTLLGFLLRFIRYSLVGISGTYLAPLVFQKINLLSISTSATD